VHVHTWVCLAVTDLVLAVSWRNAGPWLHGESIWAHSAG